MIRRGNLHTNLPDASRDEITQVLAAARADGVTIERIVSEGQSSPPGFWYDQEWDEWVAVLAGAAELEFEGPSGEERLGPGDWMYLPAHRRHRVRSTESGTVWLAVHASLKPIEPPAKVKTEA